MSVKRAFSFRSATGLTAAVLFVSAFFLVFSFIPSVQTANACPEEMPVPLRELYMQSDRVVVATVSGSSIDKVESEDESGKSVTMKISLNVSETLKGEGTKPLIHLYQWQYISNNPDTGEGVEENEGDDEDANKKFERGKKLLLFLSESDDDEGKAKKNTRFALVDYRYGAKDLSGSDLSVYVKRIKELSKILKNKQPDKKEIVEWLVRCVEEPATRWEGAYDLNRSFNLKTYEEENQQKADAESNEGEEAESNEAEDADAGNEENADSPVYEEYDEPFSAELARLVTDSHKQRLSNALYQTKKLTRGDYQLINLVKHWEGKKVATFLLPQLRALGQDDPEAAMNIMNQIAGTVDDKELTKLANLYEQIYYMDKDDEVDLAGLEASLQDYEEETNAPVEESEESNGSKESAPAENVEASSDKELDDGAKEEAKPKAGQVRSDILERFVSLCESLLAKNNTNSN